MAEMDHGNNMNIEVQAVGAAAVPATEQLTVPDHIARDVEQAESTDRWNEGVPFKSRWERKLYESGFAAGWDRARVLVPASTSAPAEPTEPVGEIVMFGGLIKEVSWRKGKMPKPGTKLYAGAPDAANAGEPAARVIEIDYESRKVLVRFAEAIPEWLEIGPIALATPTGVAADESTRAPEEPTLADARRYQWLRKHKHYALLVDFGFSHSQVEHWSNEQNGAKLDAAVDAARRAPAPPSGERTSAPAPTQSQPENAMTIMNAEARASLRHFLSAALIFDKDNAYDRTLAAFDEWFRLQDSAPSTEPPAEWPFPADATHPGMKGPSFDRFVDSLTTELIAAPDAEILDGQDPAEVKARGTALLDKAKEAAIERAALDAYNAYFFKCSPTCSVETWTAAWKKAVSWAAASPSGERTSAPAPEGSGEVDGSDTRGKG